MTEGKAMDPAEYLLRMEDDFQSSPIVIPGLLSPNGASQYPSHSGVQSTCGSLTSGQTLETAPMSRSNSALDNPALLGQLEMIRIQSQTSGAGGHNRHDSLGGNPLQLYQTVDDGRTATADIAAPWASTNHPGSTAYSYTGSAPTDSHLYQHQHVMKKSASQSSTSSSSSSAEVDPSLSFLADHLSMERSISKNSTSSSTSLKHRAKEALSRQNDNATKARHLKPKPPGGEIAKKEVEEPTTTKGKDGKAVISKAKYERPKHPKVRCSECNENPDGFRGEHELRRHFEAKHKPTVKKWICRDPGLAGIPHSEVATKPLSDCKHCSAQKLYGAYYNAAAHLRRTHFRLKPARKSPNGSKNGPKGSQSPTAEEKRGGKGGGDWPLMSELKLWMVEVTVPHDQGETLNSGSRDASGPMDVEDMDGDAYDGQYDNPFAGVGTSFPADHLQGIDPSYNSLNGELGAPAGDLFQSDGLYPGTSVHGLPISSSGFEYNSSAEQHQQQNMASSAMSLDGHGYTSPVSSTATLTQAGILGDHSIIPTAPMHMSRDDLDLSFDMMFGPGVH